MTRRHVASRHIAKRKWFLAITGPELAKGSHQPFHEIPRREEHEIMERIPRILNGNLARAIVELGHGELLLVCDAGLSIPKSAQLIDIALVPGIPPFIDVLKAVFAYCE